jgi:hypothetical protein
MKKVFQRLQNQDVSEEELEDSFLVTTFKTFFFVNENKLERLSITRMFRSEYNLQARLEPPKYWVGYNHHHQTLDYAKNAFR